MKEWTGTILLRRDITDLENIKDREMGIKIIGTGSALPEKTVTNKDLESYLDTNDEWIIERTGIGQRHVVGDSGETVGSLGLKAAKKAIEMAGCKPEDIDLILAASCSTKDHLPCVACQIQEGLEGCKAAAFDINAACSGFLIAMSVANEYLNSGAFKKVLLVGSEVLSNLVDWNDRGTCILFGDGAGAMVVEKSDDSFAYALGADGSGGSALSCRTDGHILMDGQAVYRFATRTVPKVVNEALDKAGKTPSDIDMYVLHQANSRIIQTIAKTLKEPIEKFPMNLNKVGNMSSASIPVLFDELNREGKVQRGQRLVLAGFGAGLTFGACVLNF